ncbi:MAG: hypothetical protein H6611_10040 [Ignavibacteriales bacterium]|nr:hypothetical protein [Ignavibacteriales bacterium]
MHKKIKSIPLSENEANEKKKKDPRLIALSNFFLKKIETNEYIKLNLVLDLDETLVSSLHNPLEMSIARGNISKQNSRIHFNTLKIKFDKDETHSVLVFYRPKIFFFLDIISKYYNIFVYSHGMKDYVNEILDNIDPGRKIFVPKNIVANPLKTQVMDKERKCLSKLGLNNENIKKTLIIDDLLNVWLEEYRNNIIISKKFFPFFEMSENKARNFGYSMLFDEEIKNYLSFSKTDTDYYLDKNLYENGELNQLENLAKKLIEISNIYNNFNFFFNNNDLLNVSDILSNVVKEIMKGLVIGICEYEILGKPHINAQYIIKILINKMGGVIANHTELFKNPSLQFHFLVVDKENLERNKFLLAELSKSVDSDKRNILVVENKWITDCYFHLSRIDHMKYLYNLKSSLGF